LTFGTGVLTKYHIITTKKAHGVRCLKAKFHYTGPTGPARTLSQTRTDPTEFLGDPGRKKSPCGSGRVRVVEFSYYGIPVYVRRLLSKRSTSAVQSRREAGPERQTGRQTDGRCRSADDTVSHSSNLIARQSVSHVTYTRAICRRSISSSSSRDAGVCDDWGKHSQRRRTEVVVSSILSVHIILRFRCA